MNSDTEFRRNIFPIDIQFFASAEEEGRTEAPTPRRRGKAEGEGQFPRTKDLPAPLAILIVAVFLRYWLPDMIKTMKEFTELFLSGAMTMTDPTPLGVIHMIGLSLDAFIRITLPVMLLAGFIMIAADVAQVGFHFNFNFIKFNIGALKPDFTRVLMRLVPNKETLVELVKGVGKILIVGGVSYAIFMDNFDILLHTVRMELGLGLQEIGMVAYKIVFWTCVILIIFAIPDYFYQRHEYMDKLKMTKEEVKDERKSMDGDPMIKSAQRKRMLDNLTKSMIKNVPKADVVIMNPTHFAVALKYEQTAERAPMCLAKGRDYMALRIRDIAEKAGVPIYEDKFLARALYDAVEIGEEIPPQFYESVAEVLAFVYRLKEGAAV